MVHLLTAHSFSSLSASPASSSPPLLLLLELSIIEDLTLISPLL
jgi:hypothetical protein